MRKVLYQCPDLSGYQGVVNFRAMRDGGYRAAILRAGWGQNNRDPSYEQNARACAGLNIPAAIYWFSYALKEEEVLREAQYAIAAAREYWNTCPIAFDLEAGSRSYAARNGVNLDRKACTRHAVLFLETVRKAGFLPILYLNQTFWKDYFDVPEIQRTVPGTLLWLAYYSGSEPKEIGQIALWQYTNKARIPGVRDQVDLNKAYVDIFSEYIKPTQPKNPAPNLYIQSFQKACNEEGYRDENGQELITDGIEGPKTQSVMRQIRLKAKWTMAGYRTGSVGKVVSWLQSRLRELGYPIEVDGRYGAATRQAVLQFQRDHSLEADGVAGYNTLQMLFYV